MENTRKPPSFAQQVMRSGRTPIHFIVCKDGKGRDCHYFLMCTREKLKMLMEKRGGISKLAEYGQIIASGLGKEVSEATRKMLLEKYRYDVDTLV